MLKRGWQAWKRLAHAIGTFQARILLTIFYALVVLPFGLVVRFFHDPLRMKQRHQEWLELPHETQDLRWAKRQ